jgi:hypothetical protein
MEFSYFSKFLVWIILGYGIADLLVNASIFNGMRNLFEQYIPFLYRLFSCIICTGIWVGFFLSVSLWSPINEMFGNNQYLNIVFDGVICGTFAYWIKVIENRI